MQLSHVPRIDVKYWAALILASVFGANTGDFFADALHLGHLRGLPVLAVLFTLAILAERFDRLRHYVYFWFVIVVIRTSATNIGDIAHDLRLYAPYVILALATCLLAVVMCWRAVFMARLKNNPDGSGSIIVTNSAYWLSMLLAGTLGTVIGDYFSFGLHLFPFRATLVLGGTLALTFIACRRGLTGRHINILFYWLTIVLIRSAGTSLGDFCAAELHLPVSTLLSGLAFVALLLFWKAPTSHPSKIPPGTKPAP